MSFLHEMPELYAKDSEEHARLVKEHDETLLDGMPNLKRVVQRIILAIAHELQAQRFRIALVEKDGATFVYGHKFIPSSVAPELDQWIEPLYRVVEQNGHVNVSLVNGEIRLQHREIEKGYETWQTINSTKTSRR